MIAWVLMCAVVMIFAAWWLFGWWGVVLVVSAECLPLVILVDHVTVLHRRTRRAVRRQCARTERAVLRMTQADVIEWKAQHRNLSSDQATRHLAYAMRGESHPDLPLALQMELRRFVRRANHSWHQWHKEGGVTGAQRAKRAGRALGQAYRLLGAEPTGTGDDWCNYRHPVQLLAAEFTVQDDVARALRG